MSQAMHTSLGFSEEVVPIGTHLCLIFTNEEERVDSLLRFMLSGLVGGERSACFSDKVNEETLRVYLAKHDISYDERKKRNAISFNSASEVYFKDGKFDPERMINTLSDFYQQSLAMGFSASRVIGEMLPEIESIPGGERLFEYESRVTMHVKKEPITAVCQYDANLFDGATIMNVLKVHPKMIVNGSVVNNPFYIEPEEFLNEKR